ncbi:tRNA-dihydrouridine(16/17) synthase [NAD(P)(+)] [Malassezia caprae]|uniref:tRNA-dihydrouridine synthase n=1 Tax=Malassezia caprae TaxID=1381934 RepID=A0AAF0E5V2_9BASI|nr:tRNA-dihydrouridine(16/17) synthase [NAD(P)(+)] [Malassezia caprae]
MAEAPPWFRHVAAPMVDQSDVAFRLTTVQYGATATWTQMYHTHDVLRDADVLARARRELEMGRHAPESVVEATGKHAPQIVQLAGNDPASLVEAARLFEPWANGIDLNLGCPQTRAQRGHYGGYLLARKDWDQVESCIRALSHGVQVPVTAKLRLCDYAPDTCALAVRLAQAGAQVITLHARHVAPNRRRAGAAKLEYVRDLVDALHAHELHTAVISNGNVQKADDIAANLAYTRADGIMIGEPLLVRPDLFAGAHHARPNVISTFLHLSAQYPTAPARDARFCGCPAGRL